jgi:hypothetical protein
MITDDPGYQNEIWCDSGKEFEPVFCVNTKNIKVVTTAMPEPHESDNAGY